MANFNTFCGPHQKDHLILDLSNVWIIDIVFFDVEEVFYYYGSVKSMHLIALTNLD